MYFSSFFLRENLSQVSVYIKNTNIVIQIGWFLPYPQHPLLGLQNCCVGADRGSAAISSPPAGHGSAKILAILKGIVAEFLLYLQVSYV